MLGRTGRPPGPIGRVATSRMRSAMRPTVVASCTPAQTAARRSSSSWPTRSSGRSAEDMWRPSSRRTTLVPGRPRSSTIRSSPSMRITITAAAPQPAGWSAHASRSSSEKRVGRPVEGSISAAVCGSAPTRSARRVTHWTSAPSPATKVVSTGHQPPPEASSRYSTVSAPGPRIQPRWSAITRSTSSGWIRAWTGLPISVSRGTPVSSVTSEDAYRNEPAASCTDTSARTLPASSRKRCSQGSGA